MPIDDATPPAEEPTTARRRRTPRAWSSPSTPLEREQTERPVSPSAWGAPPAQAPLGEVPPDPPPGVPSPPAPVGAEVEGTVVAELRSELQRLTAAVSASSKPQDATAITATELATTIETLGTTLGNGMAGLLSDHRALLARDVEAAAERILEEVNERLRAAVTQTVEGVDERIRQVSARGLSALGEELELRLDQIQADLTGLRAVMLEIPDQTAVLAKLDQLGDSGGARKDRDRLPPAVAAALDRTVAAPLGRLETAVGAVAELVEELDARVAEGGSGDAAAIEALTSEVTSLRRRLTLRSELKPPTDDEPADEAPEATSEEDAADEDEVPPPPPTRRVRRTAAGARVAKAAAKKGSDKPAPGRRRGAS